MPVSHSTSMLVFAFDSLSAIQNFLVFAPSYAAFLGASRTRELELGSNFCNFSHPSQVLRDRMPKALPPAPSKRASGRSQAQRAQIYALHMANAARNAVNFGGTAARATVLQPLAMTDRIIISSLRLNATVGPDRWRKRRAQPTDLSITLTVDLAQAGQADDVNATVNYGTLSKSLTSRLDGAEFESLHALAAEAAAQALAKPGVLEVIVDAEALNQFLLAKSAGERLHRRINDNNGLNPDEAYIYDLRLNVIIGVNPLEREFKQEVVTNIVFIAPTWTQPDWLGMHDNLVKVSAFYHLHPSYSDLC